MMTHEMLQSQHLLPDKGEQDVTSDLFAGSTAGMREPYEEQPMLTAYEITFLRRRLCGFCNADLKQIPVLPAGSSLKQGALYLDLTEHPPCAFTAHAGMKVAPEHFYVPQHLVPDRLWCRLLGRPQPDPLWKRLTGGDLTD
jgi:hypothetical protein